MEGNRLKKSSLLFIVMLVLAGVLQSYGFIRVSNANPETILYASPSKTTICVGENFSVFSPITSTDFILEVTQVQSSVSREGGVTYFKLPTLSLFGPNTVVYDNVRQAVWMTSTNITYGDWGSIETFNGVMVMLNVTDGSASLYEFPLDVGAGFKGLVPVSCMLDDDGNVWIAIGRCYWVPEELPESIPSVAKLYPTVTL